MDKHCEEFGHEADMRNAVIRHGTGLIIVPCAVCGAKGYLSFNVECRPENYPLATGFRCTVCGALVSYGGTTWSETCPGAKDKAKGE